MILRCGCKINLGLAITGVLPGGYHTLDSLFYPIENPHDALEILISAKPGIRVYTRASDIDPENNTLTRIYQALKEVRPHLPGLDVHLHKGIPVGAGLGGGSSDAASLLNWLTSIVAPLTDEEKRALASSVGADVPFFLQEGPARVQGIGDKLEEAYLEGGPWYLLLTVPTLRVSTSWAYATYDTLDDSLRIRHHALTKQGFSLSLRLSSGELLPWTVSNDLENVVLPMYPALQNLKDTIYEHGALVSAMSGSGSAMYGLFAQKDKDRMQQATVALQEQGVAVYQSVLVGSNRVGA